MTWTENSGDIDNVTATFVAQVCTESGTCDDDWEDTDVTATGNNVGTVGGSTVEGTLDGSFKVRVQATLAATSPASLPTGDDAPMVYSSVASLGGIDPKATDVKAVRGENEAENDTVGVTWKAETTDDTQQRVVIEVDFGDDGKHWVVAAANDAVTAGTGTAYSWNLDIQTAVAEDGTSWTLASGSGSFTVTRAALLKAIRVRVDASHDGETWMMGGIASVPAKSN